LRQAPVQPGLRGRETAPRQRAALGAAPGEALVVEDSSRGLASAVAAGIDCAVVHHDFTAAQDFTTATHRIRTLAELPALVLDGA